MIGEAADKCFRNLFLRKLIEKHCGIPATDTEANSKDAQNDYGSEDVRYYCRKKMMCLILQMIKFRTFNAAELTRVQMKSLAHRFP